MMGTTRQHLPAVQCIRRAPAAILAAAFWLGAIPAMAQESIIKAEELIRLQSIPLSRPVSFEIQNPSEQIDFLAWITLRALDSSSSWNPRNRAWSLYRLNIRHSLEQALRQRWQSSGGIIRSLSQNPDTALAKFYADGLSSAELDEALAFFRSEAGKKYTLYLRELTRVYYNGHIEIDRISFDPEFGKPGDTVAMRRKAWMEKKNISLDPVPAGYAFHVTSAQALFPAAKPEAIILPLIAGAPPGTEGFRRLDMMVSGAERDAVSRFLQAPASDKEKQVRKAWGEAIATTKDVQPLILNDIRGVIDVVAEWKKIRSDPRGLPRSIAQVDPASVEIGEQYKSVSIEDAGMPDAVKACLAGVSDRAIRGLTENFNGRSYREVTRVISLPEGKNIFLARQGIGACIPTTVPGYPVPAVNSFVNTLRVVGMDDDESRRWYRGVAQEVAANGASESLIVLPNGNAYEISYAVNVRRPDILIYSHRLFFAGTYEPQRYRTVQHPRNFKTLQTVGSGNAAGGVVQYEKSLLSTPDEIRREQERRARETPG